MKNYKEFLVEDFVQDAYFRAWAAGKLGADDRFWENWQELNPQQQIMIQHAKMMVRGLTFDEQPVGHAEIDAGLARIFENTTRRKPVPLYRGYWVRAAAMLLLVSGLAWLGVILTRRTQNAGQVIISSGPASQTSKIIRLADGSVVRLKGTGKLIVDKAFGAKNRTVFLTGEAFFEIMKNPQKPFLVVTGNLVTRVLGTSFLVKDNPGDSAVSVSVRTGKVTVFRNEGGNYDAIRGDHVLLTPNQKVVLVGPSGKLEKTLVEEPVMLAAGAAAEVFEYSEAPIPLVFDRLEQAYGVKISFDRDLLAGCTLNATLGDESLFEKLDLICETIHASYQVIDGQITVLSKGCK
ncbi:hypothetical protein GCM10010967_24160 [Dyadobacter beijingensis]|uniref:FecR family protein n=1 Tax=Dyadobacter beijingensis TaxID=365489 RepID=A0ABQ2HSJ3_9BACT|nr:FecR family protein [Dyadobacter beijingensis]GGM90351.1 hypothetical protein GCM10010967_24160 [Dyadobacter beijingensis]